MKGTVYSGIVRLAEHPEADMHGLIRVVMRCRSWLDILERLNEGDSRVPPQARQCGIWQESKSHVEEQATERHYGELLACPLVLQYLKPENYKPIPKSLLRRKP